MAKAKGAIKKVEVGGRTYAVDMARAKSWTAVKMLARIQSADGDAEQGTYAIQYADYVLGDAMNDVVDACGGDDAPAEDVIKLAYEGISAAAKN